jgi:hypothetical protein
MKYSYLETRSRCVNTSFIILTHIIILVLSYYPITVFLFYLTVLSQASYITYLILWSYYSHLILCILSYCPITVIIYCVSYLTVLSQSSYIAYLILLSCQITLNCPLLSYASCLILLIKLIFCK